MPVAKLTEKAHVITKDGKEQKINEYFVSGPLGQMGRAQLLLCNEQGGPVLLIKRFNKPTVAKYQYTLKDEDRNEIELASFLNHENLVNTIEIINDNQWSNVFMVMEFCSRGETMTMENKKFVCKHFKATNKGKIPDEYIKRWIKGALRGLRYMHENLVAHRDIKPANLLIGDDEEVRIADFGISERVTLDDDGRAMVETNKNGGLVGTQPFLPIEAFGNNTMDAFKADIWALGATMYVFINAKLPVYEPDSTRYVEKLKRMKNFGNESFNKSKLFMSRKFRPDAKHKFLKTVLNVESPEDRPSAEELLRHDYLN